MMCSSKRCLRVSFASKKLFGESFFFPSLNISRKSNIWFFGYDKVFFASGCTSYLEISETYFCSRGGSSRSDWVRRVSCLVQILGEKNLNSKQPSGGSLKTFVIALILIFQVASQKPAVFFFTDVCKKFRDICEEEHCRLLDSNLKY